MFRWMFGSGPVSKKQLMAAIEDGDLNLVKKYIHENANTPGSCNFTDYDNYTPLMVAALNARQEIIDLLLKEVKDLDLNIAGRDTHTAYTISLYALSESDKSLAISRSLLIDRRMKLVAAQDPYRLLTLAISAWLERQIYTFEKFKDLLAHADIKKNIMLLKRVKLWVLSKNLLDSEYIDALNTLLPNKEPEPVLPVIAPGVIHSFATALNIPLNNLDITKIGNALLKLAGINHPQNQETFSIDLKDKELEMNFTLGEGEKFRMLNYFESYFSDSFIGCSFSKNPDEPKNFTLILSTDDLEDLLAALLLQAESSMMASSQLMFTPSALKIMQDELRPPSFKL